MTNRTRGPDIAWAGGTSTLLSVGTAVCEEPEPDDNGHTQCCINLRDKSRVYVQGEAGKVAGIIRAAAAMDPADLVRAAKGAWAGVAGDA